MVFTLQGQCGMHTIMTVINGVQILIPLATRCSGLYSIRVFYYYMSWSVYILSFVLTWVRIAFVLHGLQSNGELISAHNHGKLKTCSCNTLQVRTNNTRVFPMDDAIPLSSFIHSFTWTIPLRFRSCTSIAI